MKGRKEGREGVMKGRAKKQKTDTLPKFFSI